MEVAVSDTVGPGAEIREQAELAADLGYESFWTQELVDTKDGITTATALGAWDVDLDVVVGLPSPYTRHPALIATEVCSVDDYAGGVAGLALATSAPEVVEKMGVEMDRPIKRLSETNDILRALIREGELDYDGELYQLDDWTLRAEFHDDDLPLYLAGMGPKMRELAAAKFDGIWLPFNATAPFVADVAEQAADHLDEFGRDRSEFLVALNIPTAVVSPDSELSERAQIRDVLEFTAWHCCSDHIRPLVERAGVSYDIDALRRAVRADDYDAMREIVDDEFLNTVAAVGSPERVRERYREYADAGVECAVVYNYGPRELKLRNVRELAPDRF